MTHCRECNSEIAETEGFCPHCGISLNPIGLNDPASASDEPDSDLTTGSDDDVVYQTPAASEEIDMSETIVIKPGEVLTSKGAEDDAGEDDDFVDVSELSSSGKTAEPVVLAGSSDSGAATAQGKDSSDSLDLDEGAEDGDLINADEEEIDLAVSVIDEKVEAWRDNDLNDASDEEKAEDVAGNEDAVSEDVGDVLGETVLDATVGEIESDEPVDGASLAEVSALASEEETGDTEGAESAEVLEEISETDEAETVGEEIQEEIETPVEEIMLDETAETDSESVEVTSTSAEIEEKAEQVETVEAANPVQEIEVDISEDGVVEEVQALEDVDPGILASEAEDDAVEDEETEEVEAAGLSDSTESVSAETEETEDSEPVLDVEELLVADDSEITVEGDDSESDGAEIDVSADVTDDSEVTSESDVSDVANDAEIEVSADVADDSESDADSEDGESKKAFTTPNIGGPDTDGSKTPKLRPLDEGTVLNERYEIVRKIGGGGMGAVYLASDKNLGGVLRAVKEMVQSYIEKEQQEKAVQDFKRESMLLTSLEHAAIPTIYDYFFDEAEARFYLVMKYISGGDLAARLRAAPEGRLDEASITQWGIEIADVLDYLHNRQPPIVYRDLKPSNVMIDGNSGKLMLVDFGIARWVNKEEKGVTAVGTMGYAPPELFSGNVVPGSDIYSLGSTMFHLLTGADPQNNPLLIFDFQKHPRPRQINPNLSDQMERILMQSVEYNAEKRFPSAADMRNALERHLHNLKTGQVSYGITESPVSVALSDQPVFCGFCGQKIVATDMFCAFCGAKQPLAQPGIHSQEYFVPQTTAKLVVEGTSDLNLPSFDLAKKENLVGRRDPMSNIFPEVDLSKFDPQTKISRKHARIWREGDSFMLEDLGSSNGTLIIRPTSETQRLAPHQSQVLKSGDKIQVGDTTLQFLVG